MGRRRSAAWVLATALAAAMLLQPARASGRPAPRRSALQELIDQSVAAVPQGYDRAGHRDTGWELPQPYSVGASGHETLMFTAEGTMYRKPVEDSSHLPRRLSEIRTFAANSSASLNPDLACDGCPTTDTRVEVQDTTATPWDAIGLLDRADANSISNGIAQCSGSLIGAQRQHVLTAGHCLIDSSSSSDNVDKITFYPGLSGSDAPFSSLTAVKARVLRQYVEERSATTLALNYDFALITLSNGAPDGTTYLNIAAGQGTVTLNLTTAGYPADRSGQDMWTVNCSNVDFDFTNGPSELDCGSQCANIVVHDCLSYEGQSGSAIWSTDADNRTIRAVLTGAVQESDGTTYNVATQLNAFVYNTIVGWYNEDVTDGLTLAPPAPPASNQLNSDAGITETLGNTSWWRQHWWWVVAPIAAVVLFLALGSVLTACVRRGCCGGKRASRPIVGAARPPACGTNPYPNQGSHYGYGYGAQQNAGRQQTAGAGSNFARYGPGYYNGYGSTGSAWPTETTPAGYPR